MRSDTHLPGISRNIGNNPGTLAHAGQNKLEPKAMAEVKRRGEAPSHGARAEGTRAGQGGSMTGLPVNGRERPKGAGWGTRAAEGGELRHLRG